ncbi:MAG: hypothetical protein PARBA_04193 [Parabacteroides sp.]
MNIKHNGNTVKSYTIWRGASYFGYPTGEGSPYYTAIKKGGYWWSPVNCGATRVARPNDGKNGTIAGTGNIYQWGRADYTNHGGSIASGPISNSRPNDHVFYEAPDNPYNWLNTQNNTLWNGSNKGINDPCPKGYRVPTIDELKSIGNANSWDSNGGLFKVNAERDYPQLVLPAAGCRNRVDGLSLNQGTSGGCWSSSVYNTDANFMEFKNENAGFRPDFRARGYSVRCIRE